jgi:ADP-L-glycero-D-manno-heptose 6-epimerase|tara:strand:+ start:30 stop:974 length:945 start_codon:yes stop_codon:yes gene_type:complete
MYIVTGGAGFIGSNLVRMLIKSTKEDVLVVDNLSDGKKFLNISDLTIADYMDQDEFLSLIKNNDSFFSNVKCVFHQGACSDTTEWDGQYMMKNNYTFSKILLNACLEKNVRFIYASSAAVYGSSMGFKEQKKNEKPLNIYGYSKLLFDQYVRKLKLTNEQQVVGLRYFNVYGPRESHKGSMASVAYHFNEQIKLKNMANLFKGSHGYSDGEQQRDFIYVDDVCNVNLWFLANSHISGIYNLGTGKPTSFNEVAKAIISWHKKGTINYIDFPKDLEIAYQCYTSADLENFRNTGCDLEFKDINEGIHQYLDHLSE